MTVTTSDQMQQLLKMGRLLQNVLVQTCMITALHKNGNLSYFLDVETLWKGTVSAEFSAIRSKLCENCGFSSKLLHQDIR